MKDGVKCIMTGKGRQNSWQNEVEIVPTGAGHGFLRGIFTLCSLEIEKEGSLWQAVKPLKRLRTPRLLDMLGWSDLVVSANSVRPLAIQQLLALYPSLIDLLRYFPLCSCFSIFPHFPTGSHHFRTMRPIVRSVVKRLTDASK